MRLDAWILLIGLLGAGSLPAAVSGYPQLWQIGGHPLIDLNELDGAPGPLPHGNPAMHEAKSSFSIGWRQQFQTGSARDTGTRAVPRSGVLIPQAFGAGGQWRVLHWRAGFEQCFSLHEEYRQPTPEDALGSWTDRDSRLEAVSAQVALKALNEKGWRPDLRIGAGYSRLRLVIDQAELQRRLLADAWRVGLALRLRKVSLALAYQQETTWNHWDTVLYPWDGGSLDTVQVWACQPQQIHLQTAMHLSNGLSLEATLRWFQWSRQLLGLRDRVELGLLAHQQFPRAGWRLHGGICTSGSTASRSSPRMQNILRDEQSTWFLLAGVEKELGPFVGEIKVADSHLGSGAFRRQTVVQAELRWHWPDN